MDSPQRAITGTVRDWLERSAGPRRPGDVWLHRGMLKDKDPVSQQEAATEIARELLSGADLDVAPWLGPAIADGWFLLRYQGEGEERHDAEKLLREMIEASGDPDAWQALNAIAARLHEERRRFPDELATWAARVHRGEFTAPPQRQSNKGEPPYARLRRDTLFVRVFVTLRFLGLPKMKSYAAIAEASDVYERAVMRSIEAARLDATPWVRTALAI